jgi:hypothetical protein
MSACLANTRRIPTACLLQRGPTSLFGDIALSVVRDGNRREAKRNQSRARAEGMYASVRVPTQTLASHRAIQRSLRGIGRKRMPPREPPVRGGRRDEPVRHITLRDDLWRWRRGGRCREPRRRHVALPSRGGHARGDGQDEVKAGTCSRTRDSVGRLRAEGTPRRTGLDGVGNASRTTVVRADPSERTTSPSSNRPPMRSSPGQGYCAASAYVPHVGAGGDRRRAHNRQLAPTVEGHRGLPA